MRRPFILVMATLFAMIPLAVSDDRVFADNPSPVWAGVVEIVPVEGQYSPGQLVAGGNARMQAYQVTFNEQYGAVPQIEDPEFMIVTVIEGEFALDVQQENTVIVSPAGDMIVHFMDRLEPFDMPFYELTTDFIQIGDGEDPCPVNCAVPADRVVQVTEGDTIVALEGAICIYCLLNQNEGVLIAQARIADVDFDLDGWENQFSWMQAMDDPDLVLPALDGSANGGSTVRETGVMAWAFNPHPSCRNGSP